MEPLMSDFSRSITSTGLDAMEETHHAQPMQTITVPCTFMADGEIASTPGALILHVDADELDLDSTSIFYNIFNGNFQERTMWSIRIHKQKDLRSN
jgi:hypothetical protein